jgi:YidC/Oxa1 family membrane protein insertase
MFVAVDFFAPFATLLAYLYKLWPSYGGAIVLYTLIIMIIVTPLTLKGTRSMMVLQALQPEMKRLQAQYKDDRQKLNEEMLAFYRENNINPLGGCLPLLVQLPVFLILYRVLRGLTNRASETVNFDPQYISHSSRLFEDLSRTSHMNSWGMDLARSAVQVLGEDGFVHALPYLLLVIGVAISSFVQQRQISARNPAAQSNPQQQLLMRIGPIMITFFSLIVPGGLAIYFFVSNLYRCGQQALISRTIYNTPEAKKLLEQQAKAAEEKKKSGAPEPKGFFAKLLGDAALQPRDRPGANGAAKGGASARNGGPSRGGTGAAKPPAAKTNGSGRTTPPNTRSAAARKKKKRK